MNSLEFSRSKIRNKSEKANENQIELNLSSLKNHKHTYISNKKLNKNLCNNLESKTTNSSFNLFPRKNRYNEKRLFKRPSSKKLLTQYKDLNYFESQKNKIDIFHTKTQKYFNKYNLKRKGDDFLKNLSRNTPLNKIENNIKDAINNMRIKIEKKNKLSELRQTNSPKNSLPNIYFINSNNRKKNNNKRKEFRNSLAMDLITKDNEISEKLINKKRRSSFNYDERSKKNLIKKFKKKLFIKHNKSLSMFSNNDSEDNKDIDNISKGFSFTPNSKFIFIFDLLLIITNFYNFIFIPLSIATDKDFKNGFSFKRDVNYYFIDLIFFFDFILSFFRGYYNFEMKLIRNNKKVIIHYLKRYFISDLLESIPTYTIIKIFIKRNNERYFGESDSILDILKLFLFIKPFKTFKIIKTKQNKALEEFYVYLSKNNYYLEKSFHSLIYFIVFLLFVHLFICLHIYLTFKSYPNWILNIHQENEKFISKYISSFYFMITTMTTVGYGDIVCISFIERIYHIFLLVIGTLLYTFLVSKIGNHLRDQRHEQIKLNQDLNILEGIRISYPKMSFKLYSKIKSHLISISQKKKTTGISILINGVPDAIKKDLLFKIYSNVINGFTIFKEVNNSNYIHQVLTSFIPILSKKEEIIILEKEFIENIVFVKDGRLSMEISIDLNDPYNSIQNYAEMNFIGISRKEELQNYNYQNRRNSVFTIPNYNYEDLKLKIDNILLDNHKSSLINNSNIGDKGISFNLGRINFSRDNIEQNENYQIIKILDIRKNEHFGDIHMFLEQRSPFTLKTKSRIAEILLLRKIDAIKISHNFPNIWHRIQNKSYHNLVSIKKLTFKILKQYYNTHLFNKKKNNIISNLEVTKNTIYKDTGDFAKILREKTQEKSYIRSIITKNSVKKTKLLSILSKNSENKKFYDKVLTKDLNFTDDSISNSNSLYNSQFNFPDVIQNVVKKEPTLNTNKIKLRKSKSLNLLKTPCLGETKVHHVSFKNDINNNNGIKYSFSIPKQLTNKNIIKSKYLKLKSIESMNDNSYFNYNNDKREKNDTFKISSKKNNQESLTEEEEEEDDEDDENNNHNNDGEIEGIESNFKNSNKSTEKLNIDNNSQKEILTMKNIDSNLSETLKNKIQKRKHIQKLIQFLNLQKYKINKKIIELYYHKNPIDKKDSNQVKINRLNSSNSNISTNRMILSEVLNSSSSEISTSFINKNYERFKLKQLNILSIESFEIKSSYKNINVLSNGQMIKSIKYQDLIEKIIKKTSNKDNSKIIKSILSQKDKKGKMKEEYSQLSDNKINNNQFFSGKQLPLLTHIKYNNYEESNNLSKKNCKDYIKTTSGNLLNSITEKKTSKKFKNSFNEKELNNFEKVKTNKTSYHKKEEKLSSKKNNKKAIKKGYTIGSTLYKTKKTKKSKKENNKIIKKSHIEDFLNKLDEFNKDNISKNEKISLFLDRNHDTSGIKMININNNIQEKNNNCIIY